ncbi:MAG: hypothetical protein R3348_00560 [Xanthomonadales bacterium]|nr:hypothetical protein [Xanthomonadales bacterium]
MKQYLLTMLIAMSLALAAPTAAYAQSLQEAARMAARQYNAKVLSARTINRGKQRIHEIKLLTKDGVVKTVRIPDRRPRK